MQQKKPKNKGEQPGEKTNNIILPYKKSKSNEK